MIKKLLDNYFMDKLTEEIITALKIKIYYKYEFKVVKNKIGIILLCNRVHSDHYITIFKCKYKDALYIYCHSFYKTLDDVLQAVRLYYEK